jgi:hypothetical protein
MSSARILLRCAAALACLVSLVGALGCSTHTMQLKYAPTAEIIATRSAPAVAMVGSIRDDRNEESTWFGAIRGGYGNPLKKLHADQEISAVVTTALHDALEEWGLLAPKESATLRIDGILTEFQCNYYWNRDAHVHLTLNVVDVASHSIVFSQSYKTDTKESGVGAGIFGSVDHLAAFTQKTMNQTIDKALADPTLLAALTSRQSAPHRATAADRLKQLDALRRDGLISDAEYEAKRREVLGEI